MEVDLEWKQIPCMTEDPSFIVSVSHKLCTKLIQFTYKSINTKWGVKLWQQHITQTNLSKDLSSNEPLIQGLPCILPLRSLSP